ncbi:MAG: 4Fe-4S dicluster domain-containing protein [Sedimentisphaerales bacterium]|nr:4Fe-4S dicluster domain-containing protein [Sedimentisphaerales bacterium]
MTKQSARFLVRATVLGIAVIILFPFFSCPFLLSLVPAMSPLTAVASLFTVKKCSMAIGIGLILGGLVALRHRWFCRWVCPTGLCMDGASVLGRRLGYRPMRKGAYGQWFVFIILGAALLGYPLLLWLDPLAQFSGLAVPVASPFRLAAWSSVIFFVALLFLNVFRPNVWCSRFCPLGAFQDITIWLPCRVRSRLRFAPKDNKPLLGTGRLARRAFIGLLLGAAGACMIRLFHSAGRRLLRPPGAIHEEQFTGLCSRCGNCIRSCPAHIIQRQADPGDWAGFLTPVLRFEKDYCLENCTRCTQACPTGALSRITIAQKPNIKIGKARVDMNLCLLGEDRECSVCRRWCPYDAIRYVFSQEMYMLVPVIDPVQCNGCGACEAMCPARPHKAIVVAPI